MKRPLSGILAMTATVACPPAPSVPERSNPESNAPAEHQRYLTIRRLLGEEPQSAERAERLLPLVSEVCRDDQVRRQFVDSVGWSTGYATEDGQGPERLALEVLEHVATACARIHPGSGLELLGSVQPHIRFDRGRLFVLEARLAAVQDDLQAAEAYARKAVKAGSVHAVALLANVQARQARQAGPAGYRSGMLDEAIATTETKPEPKWQAIDLAAILSTRARLLTERAFWEDGEARTRSLEAAHRAFRRLSVPPFLAATRRSALDPLCFDAPRWPELKPACETGAREFGMLGAARVAGLDVDELEEADAERAAALTRARSLLRPTDAEALGVWVVRGDETEVLEWARPTRTLLRPLPKMRWLVVDRTSGPRADAVVGRIVQVSGLEPELSLDLDRNPRAVPCVAALVSGRVAPDDCPLSPPMQKRVAALPTPRFVLLTGRDLDAELDDFGLYEVPRVLMSLRKSQTGRGVPWLKSLSDVWWLTDPSRPAPRRSARP
jgi:hypothetical protein